MSGTKISGLASGTVKATDVHVAVDTTDTSMAPSGTDKKYLMSALKTFNNTTVTIVDGTMNNVTVGATTATTGKFTTLQSTTSITNSAFGTAGVVHNNSSGLFSSSLIVDADITTNTITNAKRAQMATLTIKGNNTGGTANEADLTTSQVKTMLGLPGSISVVYKQITFGDDIGNISSDADFTFDPATKCLYLGTGTAEGSALFQMFSTTKTFMPPRMTSGEKFSITPSISGGIVYDLTESRAYQYMGSSWVPMGGLGNMQDQNADAVNITGGTLSGVSITATNIVTGGLTFPSFTTPGFIFNDNMGICSSQLVSDSYITTNTISNSRLNQVPANTIRGNNTGSTADIINLTPAEVSSMIGAITSAALSSTHVGFGDGSNLLSGSTNFLYDGSNVCLSLNRTGGASFNSTAILLLESTTSLFYPPIMTTDERTGITPFRGGGICFDSNTNQFMGWNASSWVIIA